LKRRWWRLRPTSTHPSGVCGRGTDSDSKPARARGSAQGVYAQQPAPPESESDWSPPPSPTLVRLYPGPLLPDVDRPERSPGTRPHTPSCVQSRSQAANAPTQTQPRNSTNINKHLCSAQSAGGRGVQSGLYAVTHKHSQERTQARTPCRHARTQTQLQAPPSLPESRARRLRTRTCSRATHPRRHCPSPAGTGPRPVPCACAASGWPEPCRAPQRPQTCHCRPPPVLRGGGAGGCT
jgi:hypothetical protein